MTASLSQKINRYILSNLPFDPYGLHVSQNPLSSLIDCLTEGVRPTNFNQPQLVKVGWPHTQCMMGVNGQTCPVKPLSSHKD